MLKDYDMFDKYMLSNKEIEKAQENGLLSEDITSLLTYRKNDGYYHRRELNSGYFQSVGVRVVLAPMQYKTFDIFKETFYVTDFYLICCEGHEDWRMIKKGSGEEEVYDSPDKLKIIPLNKVEYIKVELADNYSGYMAPVTREVKKDPVKGAVVGAVVAGATGAVIGAAMNSGTETKTILPGGSFSNNYFNLKIKLKDEAKEFFIKDFFQADAKLGKDLYEAHNRIASALLSQAKSNLSKEEKQKIVDSTISVGKDVVSKEKRTNMIYGIGFFIVLAIVIFVCEEFC